MMKVWYQKNIFSYILFPFSLIYQIIIAVREFLYHTGIKKTTRFPIPIIVVGNITAGGTGKTPLVIWLANFLREQGFKPGIVSRGYGGKAAQYPYSVNANSDPQITGDEALLIVRHTQCPMVIDPKRVNAVKRLLANNHCDIIISDDGLQHYALARDIEIAVIDGERGLGNGFCLPAGPLREPAARLKQVDFIVVNGVSCQPKLASSCRSDQGAPALAPTINMQLVPGDFTQLINPSLTKPTDYFKNKTIHAVAGIGNPQRFFKQLKQMSLTIIEHPFSDHYLYQAKDLNFASDENTIVIMTEKDAVKCEKFAKSNWWFLPVKAEINKEFSDIFLKLIKKVTICR